MGNRIFIRGWMQTRKKFCKGKCEGDSELPYKHDTYDRRIQLGAARERLKDAEALHHVNRCTGAIYLGGYAIECSLKALICSQEHKNNFKDTEFYKGNPKTHLHDLNHLLKHASLDIVTVKEPYKSAWNVIIQSWHKDELRYWDKLESNTSSERFLASVKKMYGLILYQLERK
jgi:hypothetical protein